MASHSCINAPGDPWFLRERHLARPSRQRQKETMMRSYFKCMKNIATRAALAVAMADAQGYCERTG
jgi:hypothetical protein